MSSKTFEQLMLQIGNKVEQEDFEKKASASNNLSDLWMQAMGAQAEPKKEEDNEMYEFTKQAAAQEDALNTMCVYAAADMCTEGMSKQASAMNKEAAQRMIINHCSRFGVSAEQCLVKEASNRMGRDLRALTNDGTSKFWAGFRKAAADASAGSADGAAGIAPNTIPSDYNGYVAQAPNVDAATGKTVTVEGSGTIESMIAKVLSGTNYGYQGVLSHDFLPKA